MPKFYARPVQWVIRVEWGIGAYHKCIRGAGKGCEIKDVMHRPHAKEVWKNGCRLWGGRNEKGVGWWCGDVNR